VAAGDVVEAAPAGVGVLELPVAIAEDAIVGPGGRDLGGEQVVAVAQVCIREQATREPGRAAGDERAGTPSTRNSSTPQRLSFSGSSRRLLLPTAWTSCACRTVGTWTTRWPLFSASSRVLDVLPSTSVIFGGAKSRPHTQAAAITPSVPPWLAETSTVGPWLMRRLAFSNGTGRM